MWRDAGAHIVFCVNLEESVLQSVRENRGQVFMLETGTGKPRGVRRPARGATPLTNCRSPGGVFHDRPHSSCRSQHQDLKGVREPWPLRCTWILEQVLPCKDLPE